LILLLWLFAAAELLTPLSWSELENSNNCESVVGKKEGDHTHTEEVEGS
jgi:hypothetical protein